MNTCSASCFTGNLNNNTMATDSFFTSVTKFVTDFLSNPLTNDAKIDDPTLSPTSDSAQMHPRNAYSTKERLDKVVYSDSQRQSMEKTAKLLQHVEADISTTTHELNNDRVKLKGIVGKYRNQRGKKLPPDVALTMRDYKISISEKTKHLEKLYSYKRRYTQILYKSRTHAAHKQYTELMKDEGLKTGYAPTQFELREAEKLAKEERKIEQAQQRLDVVSGAVDVDDCLADLDDVWDEYGDMDDNTSVDISVSAMEEEGDIVFPFVSADLPTSSSSHMKEEEDELADASEALAD